MSCTNPACFRQSPVSNQTVYASAYPGLVSNLDCVSQLMLGLMLRNVATIGWVLQDGADRLSKRGCIIAASSFQRRLLTAM